MVKKSLIFASLHLLIRNLQRVNWSALFIQCELFGASKCWLGFVFSLIQLIWYCFLTLRVKINSDAAAVYQSEQVSRAQDIEFRKNPKQKKAEWKKCFVYSFVNSYCETNDKEWVLYLCLYAFLNNKCSRICQKNSNFYFINLHPEICF